MTTDQEKQELAIWLAERLGFLPEKHRTSTLDLIGINPTARVQLIRNGYETAGDIAQATDVELLRLDRFGGTSLRQVRAAIEELSVEPYELRLDGNFAAAVDDAMYDLGWSRSEFRFVCEMPSVVYKQYGKVYRVTDQEDPIISVCLAARAALEGGAE